MLIYLDQIRPRGFYNNRETRQNRCYFFDSLQCETTDDLDYYLNHNDTFKIAALYNRFNNSTEDDQFIQIYFDIIQQASNLVFVLQTELKTADLLPYLKQNVHVVAPVMFDCDYSSIFRASHFEGIGDLYIDPPETTYQARPYYFEALLGAHSNSRDFVFDKIHTAGLADKIFLNYVGNGQDQFVTEPDVFLPAQCQHSSMRVNYQGQSVPFSNILPGSVYHQCAYSLVTETQCHSSFNFYTEKTAKPLLAGRLFVMFANRYHLRNLRALGFQTFDNIIDETYDELADEQQRWTQAFEQVRWLCSQDQTSILAAVKSRIQHNQKLFTSTDWTQIAVNQMLGIINTMQAEPA